MREALSAVGYTATSSIRPLKYPDVAPPVRPIARIPVPWLTVPLNVDVAAATPFT